MPRHKITLQADFVMDEMDGSPDESAEIAVDLLLKGEATLTGWDALDVTIVSAEEQDRPYPDSEPEGLPRNAITEDELLRGYDPGPASMADTGPWTWGHPGSDRLHVAVADADGDQFDVNLYDDDTDPAVETRSLLALQRLLAAANRPSRREVALEAALKVITLDPYNRATLDPKALEQAQAALGGGTDA